MAAIATTVFSKEAKNSANILRMPDFETITITHPLSTLTQEQIRERAYEAVRSIVPIITGEQADEEIRFEEKATPLIKEQKSVVSKAPQPKQDVADCADG